MAEDNETGPMHNERAGTRPLPKPITHNSATYWRVFWIFFAILALGRLLSQARKNRPTVAVPTSQVPPTTAAPPQLARLLEQAPRSSAGSDTVYRLSSDQPLAPPRLTVSMSGDTVVVLVNRSLVEEIHRIERLDSAEQTKAMAALVERVAKRP